MFFVDQLKIFRSTFEMILEDERKLDQAKNSIVSYSMYLYLFCVSLISTSLNRYVCLLLVSIIFDLVFVRAT